MACVFRSYAHWTTPAVQNWTVARAAACCKRWRSRSAAKQATPHVVVGQIVVHSGSSNCGNTDGSRLRWNAEFQCSHIGPMSGYGTYEKYGLGEIVSAF
jgi:hypothetical protein